MFSNGGMTEKAKVNHDQQLNQQIVLEQQRQLKEAQAQDPEFIRQKKEKEVFDKLARVER